jgi:hypothetical protein
MKTINCRFCGTEVTEKGHISKCSFCGGELHNRETESECGCCGKRFPMPETVKVVEAPVSKEI